MKKAQMIFASTGTILLISFFLITNILTSPHHLWFIYPAFPMLWWPYGVYFAGRKNKAKQKAVIGTLLIITYLFIINMMTSPGHPWFLYTCFPVLWWPIAVFLGKKAASLSFAILSCIITTIYYAVLNLIFTPDYLYFLYIMFGVTWWPLSFFSRGRRSNIFLSIAGSIITIIFISAINLILSPDRFWAFHPAFIIILWPFSVYFTEKKRYKLVSICASLWLIIYLYITNRISSPGHPWFLYACFPLLWWPITAFLGKKAASMIFAVLGSLTIIIYYGILNLVFYPEYLYVFYIIFAVLWWPLSILSHKKKSPLLLAVTGTILTSCFFIIINHISSPGIRWAIYPIFGILWWPLSIISYRKKAPMLLATTGTILSICFFTAINYITSPETIWAFYPAFGILWWPLGILAHKRKSPLFLSITGSILAVVFFSTINYITSPTTIWAFYPAFGILWWPLSIIAHKRKSPLFLSVTGTILTISFLSTINYITTPTTIWAIYPAFGILWWPLSLFFFSRKKTSLHS